MRDTNQINTEFRNRNLNIIWNKLKIHKKFKVNSMLKVTDFENHFSSLMKDNVPLNQDQQRIEAEVMEKSSLLTGSKYSPFECKECDFSTDKSFSGIITNNCGHKVNRNVSQCKIARDDVLKNIKI